jgi:hypothetical protein
MKLKYITDPVDNAGTAVPGCGTIHSTEIKPTLKKLSYDLGFIIDLNNYITGSTGKRLYSGDIDLVIDDSVFNGGPKLFHLSLIKIFDPLSIRRNGDMIYLRYPIQNYNEICNELLPRTGYVQVDFNFGDIEWNKLYHYSHGSESEYKGAHRNMALESICGIVDIEKSDIVDSYNQPISLNKWKWGPKGFFRVNRHSIKSTQTDDWLKKQADTTIEGPYYDGNRIAQILFPKDGKISDLYSLETVMSAIKRNYSMVDQERIWRKMAQKFSNWKYGKDFLYPTEISQYFLLNDK